jgi:hypothetical protein
MAGCPLQPGTQLAMPTNSLFASVKDKVASAAQYCQRPLPAETPYSSLLDYLQEVIATEQGEIHKHNPR